MTHSTVYDRVIRTVLPVGRSLVDFGRGDHRTLDNLSNVLMDHCCGLTVYHNKTHQNTVRFGGILLGRKDRTSFLPSVSIYHDAATDFNEMLVAASLLDVFRIVGHEMCHVEQTTNGGKAIDWMLSHFESPTDTTFMEDRYRNSPVERVARAFDHAILGKRPSQIERRIQSKSTKALQSIANNHEITNIIDTLQEMRTSIRARFCTGYFILRSK